MFKYFVVILLLLAGCSENKIELNKSKDSLKTAYGTLKIVNGQYPSGLFFNGSEIDFDGNTVFEIVQFWKIKETILVLVSHANTNRCDQVYRIVALDKTGAQSTKSFGNCETPSTISLEGEVLKMKFLRTNWHQGIEVEYSNGNLAVSEIKPNGFDNFMIGLCEIKGDANLSECSVNAARNLDEFTTTFHIFDKDEIKINVVFGREYYKSIPPQFRKKDTLLSAPITYIGTTESNKIWVKMIGENGCTFTDEYTKVGDEIYSKAIAMDGNCSEMQSKLFQNSVSNGSEKIRYIR